MSNNDRFRNYCFTINNYTKEDNLCLEKLKCKYIIYGNEVGESGTPHLQGFIIWNDAKSFKATLALFPKSAHLEVCKGTPYDNFVYCSKGDDFVERGTRPNKQGARKDMLDIKKMVAQNVSMRAMLDKDIICNYQHLCYAEKLSKYYEKVRTEPPEVIWYYGPTGSGKTRKAFENALRDFGQDQIYFAMDTGQWFDGYDQHRCVIIDDMRKDFMKFHLLLKLLDRYPYRVQTKGSTRQFVAERVVITAPYHPSHMYDTREDIEQLLRRITHIEEIN